MLSRITAASDGATADSARLTADRTLAATNPAPPRTSRADSRMPTADSGLLTVDADPSDGLPAGWPCTVFAGTPPSVADRQSAPTPEDLYGQIAGVLTPRGPAWGTDEAGDGTQAQPVMRGLWRALATWVADLNAADWTLATQALPSAVAGALADWEAELGLPDPCGGGDSSQEGRRAAVRARHAALGGCSPAYFVCLAAALGYAITIEEPTQFMLDVSEVGPDPIEETWFRIDDGQIDTTPLESFAMVPAGEVTDEVGPDPFVDIDFRVDAGLIDATPLESFAPTPGANVWDTWIVHVRSLGETWFMVDDGEIDADPLEGFLAAAALECLIRRLAPAHTQVVFSYALAA